MKRIILCLVIIIGALTITGCGNKATENESNKSIIISDVDKGTRWEAITSYDITWNQIKKINYIQVLLFQM